MTKDQLKLMLASILALSEILAKRSPSPVDDQMVATLKLLASQDWMLDVLLRLINGGTKLTDIHKALFAAGIINQSPASPP